MQHLGGFQPASPGGAERPKTIDRQISGNFGRKGTLLSRLHGNTFSSGDSSPASLNYPSPTSSSSITMNSKTHKRAKSKGSKPPPINFGGSSDGSETQIPKKKRGPILSTYRPSRSPPASSRSPPKISRSPPASSRSPPATFRSPTAQSPDVAPNSARPLSKLIDFGKPKEVKEPKPNTNWKQHNNEIQKSPSWTLHAD